MTSIQQATSLDKPSTYTGAITKSELFTAYNYLRAIVRGWDNQKALDRLNRALGILQSKNYYTGDRMLYHPSSTDCGCKDWEYRGTKRRGTLAPCKHIFAEMLVDAIIRARAGYNITQALREVPALAI